jgi:hypothetical protein
LAIIDVGLVIQRTLSSGKTEAGIFIFIGLKDAVDVSLQRGGSLNIGITSDIHRNRARGV